MQSQGRRLVLMRHAKAEPFAAADHERALTERGRGDAVEAGLWLAANGVEPDYAIVSSAVRTTSTWEALAHALRTAPEVIVDGALYSSGPEVVLEVLRSAPADARTVIVVGHNPTVALLAHILDGGTPDEDTFREMSEGYPTCALTVLDVPVAWHEIADGTCHIAAFHVGHGAAAG